MNGDRLVGGRQQRRGGADRLRGARRGSDVSPEAVPRSSRDAGRPQWMTQARGSVTYPVLPIAPMTLLNPAMEHPSLAPEQDHNPHRNQQMRHVEQPRRREVPTRLAQRPGDGRENHVAAAVEPELPQRPGTVGEEGGQVVEQRVRARVATGGAAEGRESVALAITGSHGEVQPCPLLRFGFGGRGDARKG